MKSMLPKKKYKTIDLAPYGGEGSIRVHGMTTGDSSFVSGFLQDAARADGFTIDEIERNKDAFNNRYMLPMLCKIVERCSELDEDGVFRPLSQEEVESLPIDLVKDITDAVQELNEFPLGRKDGAAQKQERSKHIAEVSQTAPTTRTSSTL